MPNEAPELIEERVSYLLEAVLEELQLSYDAGYKDGVSDTEDPAYNKGYEDGYNQRVSEE